MVRKLIMAAALTLAVTSSTVASASADTLQSSQTFSGQPTYPPLISAVTWGRTDVPAAAGVPNEILSLVSQNDQVNSYAWPFYVQLSATTAPGATMDSSQSTGVNVRAFNNGSGSPWVAAIHSEARSGPASHGVTLAYNGEITRDGPGGLVYGLELNSMGAFPADAGINVDGKYKTGINLHGNSVLAGHVDAASLTVAGKPYVQPVPATVATPKVGRVTLAPGVWIDFSGGRVRIHRGGRIVGRF